MTKKELLELPNSDWLGKDIPLLDEIYVICTRRKHNSGYNILDVYGCAYDPNQKGAYSYAKKISGCSDVIDFEIPPIMEEYVHSDYFKKNGVRLIGVDYKEPNVARYFIFREPDYKFKVTTAWLSSCCIEVVKSNEGISTLSLKDIMLLKNDNDVSS